MKPARFEYHRPRDLDEALALLRTLPEAKLLAGGQSLIPMMNFRLVRPEHVIDLGRVADLAYIREDDDYLEIGAMTRQAAVEASPVVQRACPVLGAALEHVSHYAIRTRGTIGGSLAHADPASELPVVASALGAQLIIASAHGRRVVGPREFFLAPLTVALKPDEVLAAVRFPRLPAHAGWAFVELSRRHGDFAIVCVCAVVERDRAGRCSHAAVALGGVAGAPVRSRRVETVLLGHPFTEARLDAAAASVLDEIEPETDLHASAEYRREMARAYTRTSLAEAWRRAREADEP